MVEWGRNFIVRCVLLAVSVAASFSLQTVMASEKKIIRIVMPRTRGGYGDISANLVMAKKLALEAPSEYEIELILNVDSNNTSTEQEMVAKLWPDYRPELLEPQKKFGDRLTIYNITKRFEKSKLPPATVAVSFSSRHGAIFENAKVQYSYSEFGDFAISSEENRNKPHSRSLMKAMNKPNHGFHFFPTGAGQGGVYISMQKPSPPMSKTKLFRSLFKEREPLPMNSKIAVAYTRSPLATSKYLDALSQYAHEHASDNFVLVTKPDAALTKITRPPNLQLVAPPVIPMEVFEGLIAHTDLPPLVTGDGSLSNAIDYEKPFFYEVNAWKVQATEQLLDELLKNKPVWEILSQQELLARSLQVDVSGINADSNLFLSVFRDEKYQATFRKSLQQFRKNNSLVRTVLNDAWFFSGQGRLLISAESQNLIRRTLMDFEPTEVFHQLRDQALNSNLSIANRLAALRAVLEARMSEPKENLAMIGAIFKKPNDPGFLRFTRFLADNIDRLSIRYYISRAARDLDPQVRSGAKLILESIAAQDPEQWPKPQDLKLVEQMRSRLIKSPSIDCTLNFKKLVP